MTTVVDQVITIFDAVWKGESAAKSAALSLQQYQKMGGTAAIAHQRLAESTDALKSRMAGLGAEFPQTTKGAADAAKTFDELSIKVRQNEAEMRNIVNSTKGLGDNLKELGASAAVGAVAIAGITMAVKATFAAMKQVYDLAQEGAGIRQMTDSFNNLNATVMHSPGLLRDMIAATNGTMSEMAAMGGIMTLVAGSSETLTQKFAAAAPQLAEIAKAANKLNPTLGDTDFMFASIARGIKRLEPRLLDNLGINVRMAAANKRYSDATGIAIDAMTAEDKVMAALNETLLVGKSLIDQVGGSVESAVDPYLQLAAATENYTNAVKSNISQMAFGQKTVGDWLQGSADRLNAETALWPAIEKNIVSYKEYSGWVDKVLAGEMTYAQIEDILIGRQSNLTAEQEKRNKAAREYLEYQRALAGLLPSIEIEDDAVAKSNVHWEKRVSVWQGATAEAATYIKTVDGLLMREDLYDEMNKRHIETAREVIKETESLIEIIRDLDSATGDYAMSALDADKESSLFNESIADIGTSWREVGGRTKEQNELLKDLEDAYDKAGQSQRDYKTGIKGFAMEQDKVNEKLEEGAAAQLYYGQQIEALKNIKGDMQQVDTKATWNQENINKAVLDAADAAGASSQELVKFMLATGRITEAQAEAILEESKMMEKIQEWGQQLDAGVDPASIESDIERIKTAFESLTLDDLLGYEQPQGPAKGYEGIGGLFEDAENNASNWVTNRILGKDPDKAIAFLENVREGAKAVVETEGVEQVSGELDGLLTQLNAISKTWKIGIDIETNGSIPSRPVERIGGESERQFGGPVQAGVSYWVGEKGPEMFTPNVNGRIAPTGQSGGGGTINIYNYNRQAAAVAMTLLDMQRRTSARL